MLRVACWLSVAVVVYCSSCVVRCLLNYVCCVLACAVVGCSLRVGSLMFVVCWLLVVVSLFVSC